MLYSSFCHLQLIPSQLSGMLKSVLLIVIFCQINEMIFIVELKKQIQDFINFYDSLGVKLFFSNILFAARKILCGGVAFSISSPLTCLCPIGTRGYFYFLIVFQWFSGFEKMSPKFEGVLEVNNILSKTQRLYEGQLVGPESLAADSTGDQTLELIFCLILTL